MLYRTLTLGFLLLATPALSDDGHDLARRALLSGEVMPLAQLLDKLRPDFPGEAISVELEEKRGKLVYEILFLGPDGRMTKLYCDAKDGTVLSVKGKGKK
jgi:uncharacterized membrane protein YkoI